MRIILPFPASSLAGHAKGNALWNRIRSTKVHRAKAHAETLEAMNGIDIPAEGDIAIHVTFVPPDRRGDRVNFPHRMKPYYDGIAQALGINDRRFVPSYTFAEPDRISPGVIVTLL